MVHIPVFGIDVPEPRLAELLPDAISGVINLCSRSWENFNSTLYPLDDEQEAELFTAYANHFPPEFDKVFRRSLEGKLDNSDHLSSEANEASYDWYRRMLRTAAAGETDEVQEDVTAFKLGLEKPSIHKFVLDQYQNEQQMMEQDLDSIDEAVYGQMSPDLELQLAARDAASATLMQATESQAAKLKQDVEASRRRAALLDEGMSGGTKLVAISTLNAGAGAALGLLLFRGLGLALKQMFKPSKAKTKAKKEAKRVEGMRKAADARRAAEAAAQRVEAKAAARQPAAAAADSKAGSSKTSTASKTASTPAKATSRAGAKKR